MQLNILSNNFFLFLFIVMGVGQVFFVNAYAAAPAKVQETIEQTIDSEQKSMSAGQAWEKEQTLLQQQINQAKLEVEWYDLHIQTLKRYVEKAKSNVQTLNDTKQKLERLEIALEESLVSSVVQLSAFVKDDLPFLLEERAQRISFLRSSLDNYDIGLEEKLRRVFEALQVESDYAKSHEITSETIDTATGKHAVKVLRLGRVALFALSPDGTQGWQYSTGGYIPLPEQYVAGLQKLMQENVQTLPALPFKGAQYGDQPVDALQASSVKVTATNLHDAQMFERRAEESMLKELPPLERFLHTIRIFAAVAPLLGLLGTVSGIVKTFRIITAHGSSDPQILSGGISEALLTTEMGLLVAIPLLLAHHFLNRRVNNIMLDMELASTTLIRYLGKA